MGKVYLGIELGSTRIKALVIALCGCSTAFAGLVRMSANALKGETRDLKVGLWAFPMVTDCNKGSSAVMKLDLQTGTWTILAEIENGIPRALAIAKDGSFYVGCRENLASDNIRHYAADGSSYEVLDLGFRNVISLALNAAENVLYCGSRYGRVVKVELANDNRQTELTASGMRVDNAAFSILPKGDTLYCVDGTAAIQYTLDANTANQLPVPLVGGGLFLGRSAFVDTAFKYGMTIIIR